MRRILVLVALVLIGVPARADTPVDSAYWWIGQQTGAEPAPPQVPAGGLYVAGSPAGATAVSAVRLVLNPGLTATALTLVSAQTISSLAVDASVTTASWKAGDNQSWAGRPAAGAPLVHGVLQPDGKTLRFDLSAARCISVCSLVLTPGAGATFDAAFDKVTSSTFTVATAPGPPAPPLAQPVPVAAPAAPIVPVLPAGPLGLMQPQQSPPATLPTVVPAPQQQVIAQQPVARAQASGRSGNATAALAILLALAGFYFGWRTRAALVDPTPRTSLYDLPPAADA